MGLSRNHDRRKGRHLTRGFYVLGEGAGRRGRRARCRVACGVGGGPAARGPDGPARRAVGGAGGAPAGMSRAGRKARRHVWDLVAARHGGIPPARAAGRDLGDVIVIRLDATIVIAHSDRQQGRRTFKGTYGFHPLTAWCDNTSESLAAGLRPGNAGSNTAADHIALTDAAIAQIPARYRRRMLFTCDGAGSTHALVGHLSKLNARRGHQAHYSVGLDFDERIRDVLPKLPGSAWSAALEADGTPRPGAQVAELTGLLRHSAGGDRFAKWPPDMRILVRRENPHPGAQLSLFEQHEGKRYQVTATSTPGGQVQFPGARHRTQARVEDRILCAKATGLRHLPSRNYQASTAWCQAASTACDLLAWLRLLALDGDLAKAEPKTLRYKILHAAGRIVKGQRRRYLRIPAAWPWARDITDAFTRIMALPPP